MLRSPARDPRLAAPVAPRSPRRLVSALVSVVLAVAAFVGGAAVATSAAYANSSEDLLTSKINQVRADEGVHPLTSRSDLVAVARAWSETMASQAKLFHNPDLTSDVADWSAVGENVGYGPDAFTVHLAFMGSPGHRANIVDTDYTEVGVGAVEVDGRIWVTEVFRRPDGSSTATSAPTGSTPTPTTDIPSRGTTAFPGVLSHGSRGAAVRTLQSRLGIAVTGYYGNRTERTVTRYQRSHGLRASGVVGRRTWNRLF